MIKVPDQTPVLKRYGMQAQMDVAEEECAELIQAISKMKRYGYDTDRYYHLVEEIGDVILVLAQLVKMWGIRDDELQDVVDTKYERTLERMRAQEYTCARAD